jgi:hypothetical protein
VFGIADHYKTSSESFEAELKEKRSQSLNKFELDMSSPDSLEEATAAHVQTFNFARKSSFSSYTSMDKKANDMVDGLCDSMQSSDINDSFSQNEEVF